MKRNNYLRQLIAQGEHQSLDFKYEISDARKIARTLAAFANTKGGKILVGVRDNGSIAGVRTEEEIFMVEAAATRHCFPPIACEVSLWHSEGKKVLEVRVSEGEKKPYFAPDEENQPRLYIRCGDENKVANAVEEAILRMQSSASGSKLRFTHSENLLFSYLKEHKSVTLKTVSRIARLTSREAAETLALLIIHGFIVANTKDKPVSYSMAESPGSVSP